jgi:alkaline phosphatase D
MLSSRLMKFSRRSLILWLSAGIFANAQPAAKPYVILVSIDGFRYDYAERYQTKNILAVRDNGAAAASMIPSFPSVTFPNHISIATGLYPEHHGIVGNSFYDPTRDQEYSMRTSATDGSWDAGTPMWVLAEKQGVKAASMFWPTADAEIQGVRPSYWKLYDGSFPNEQRVQQVIDWLKLPADQRPHFITLYFSDVDSAGHRYGPEASETREAAQRVDQMIGKLREGLGPLGLPVNLILVSDHGMQTVTDGEVDLTPLVDQSRMRVVLEGPLAWIYGRDAESVEKTYQAMKGKSSRFDVFRRAETPASWHFNENPRSGDLVAIVNQASVFKISRPDQDKGRAPRAPPKGEHGYDPAKFKTMHAIFYAIGPNVKPKTRIDSFENVNVYPFIAKILGLTLPEKLDGSFQVLAPIYLP